MSTFYSGVSNFYIPLPAKAVRSAWCYLCGAIQRSIWTEMGEWPLVYVNPLLRTGSSAATLFDIFLYPALHQPP